MTIALTPRDGQSEMDLSAFAFDLEDEEEMVIGCEERRPSGCTLHSAWTLSEAQAAHGRLIWFCQEDEHELCELDKTAVVVSSQVEVVDMPAKTQGHNQAAPTKNPAPARTTSVECSPKSVTRITHMWSAPSNDVCGSLTRLDMLAVPYL